MIQIYRHDPDHWQTIATIDNSEYQVQRTPEQVREIKDEKRRRFFQRMWDYGFR